MRRILEELAAGRLSVEEAQTRLAQTERLPFARLDTLRESRCGLPEVVYAAGKSPEQCAEITRCLLERSGRAFLTRLTAEGHAAVEHFCVESEVPFLYFAQAHALIAGPLAPELPGPQTVIISAGTSDLSVAQEAEATLRFLGRPVSTLHDCGVAGLHRLLENADKLQSAGVIIVIAGMEGALPSVVGGLVRSPVIAVPTSVGYGASLGGIAALLGMLNSCASGVGVMNIDNGFGAACLAARILNRFCPAQNHPADCPGGSAAQPTEGSN